MSEEKLIQEDCNHLNSFILVTYDMGKGYSLMECCDCEFNILYPHRQMPEGMLENLKINPKDPIGLKIGNITYV